MATPQFIDDLHAFGIQHGDEGFHPVDPDDVSWNESWFWDWFSEDLTTAGHCRIGTFPNQQRFWLWMYLYRDGEWLTFDEPRLDLAWLNRDRLAFDHHGVSCSWDVADPLLAGRLRFDSFSRVVTGPRAGVLVPVQVDLDITAAGVPHAIGAPPPSPGHESEHYDARRFEQPISVSGTISIDDDTAPFEGRGERDHSWGPRAWNMEWSFFALSSATHRLQGVEVRLPGLDPFAVGHVVRDGSPTVDITTVKLDLAHHDTTLDTGPEGQVAFGAADGFQVAGTLESVTGHAIRLEHVMPEGARPVYRRWLVRFVPDDGSAPLAGWFEDHHHAV